MNGFARELKRRLRHTTLWITYRQLQHVGWRQKLICRRLVPRILRTRPIQTQPVNEQAGTPCEVHILTYNGDCVSALWAAKSFYHYAQVDYPLVWHEGGVLSSANKAMLRKHFPNSRILTFQEAGARMETFLSEGGFKQCLEARRRSIMLMKMLDCLVLSRAEQLLMLDSDVLFFRHPREIVEGVAGKINANLFNREPYGSCCYNITRQDAKELYGFELVEHLNAGLSLLKRELFTLEMIEEFLHNPKVQSDQWLTEQTLQALCASRLGVRFLPDSYLVAGVYRPGLTDETGRILVSKHYSGTGRVSLCEEGMRQLVRQGFLEELSAPPPGI